MVETTELIKHQDVEYIKLYKNETSKGVISYSWEIKTLGLDMEKLEKINNECLNKYGSFTNE
jgi:hypothetical protein